MVDRIDKFLSGLSGEELVECRERIDKLIRRPRGRPRGRSKTDYHEACRMVAYAALRAKQEWLDDNPNRKRVDNKIVACVIETEITKYPVLTSKSIEAYDAVRRHVDKRIREFLPKALRKK